MTRTKTRFSRSTVRALIAYGYCRVGILLLTLIIPATMNIATAGSMPDYALWDELLMQNVRNGFINYDGLNRDSRFLEFVGQIGSADPEAIETKGQRLAFYINAYNALAIKSILDDNSPASSAGRKRFLKREKHLVSNQEITLFALEHETIMPIGDPRIHFAIVCASLGCPRLASRAYLPENIDLQLHDSARNFINDHTRNRFDLERRIAFISMIFKWYGDDFQKAGGSVQQYLARFVDDARVQDALRLDEFELRFEDYNWDLNGYYGDLD